jgi:hypothetical protein
MGPLPPVSISKDLLAKFYGVPLPQVATALGVGSTALKKACRRIGIERWCCIKTVQRKETSQSLTKDIQFTDIEFAHEEDMELQFEEDMKFLSGKNIYFDPMADFNGLEGTPWRSDLAFLSEAGSVGNSSLEE